MVRCLGAHNRIRSRRLLSAVALALLWTAPANAQYATSCPPPKKFAAGACVITCPAGYEDQGRVCVYRNLSR
ncbi:hypothetical protein MKK75_01325 [Methylobacterium sp. J-030]|uniref:hypothetical protein n=1 Tax=Methylobacterium sp. J-030 TaxID=2836627 RepID=UPI001FBB4DD0|nr:hypothetical protein [Methylobacterium sp. J-030]MCJ2067458.1 hypothetical protein [Methylobacterium sp. J-030]